MVLAKSKKSVGLGNSLMNDRFGKGKGADMRRGAFQQGIERTGQNGEKVGQSHQQSHSVLMHRSISSTRRRRPTG
jgi:large subunit GTPase 1